jgi:hypothetical protein
MKDYPGRDAVESLEVALEKLIQETDGHLFFAQDIFPDLRDTEATFVIGPFLPFKADYAGVDEYLLNPGLVRVLRFFLILHAIENHGAVHHEQADGAVNLRGGKANAIGTVHSFPHVFEQLVQLRVVGADVFGYLAEYGMAICYDR